MQFGAVSALLLEAAIVAGPRAGMAAGLGVASADLAYAAVAAVAGGAARAALTGHEAELRAVAAATLALIALRGLRKLTRRASAPPSGPGAAAGQGRRRASAAAHYVRFLALTAVNPLTIVYFASVAASVSLPDLAARIAFVTGAGGASAIWQLLPTLVGAHAGRRLTPALQRAVAISGRLVVFGMAVRFALAL